MFDFLKKEEMPSIPVNELDSMLGTIELIDIREAYEFEAGTIKTAKNIPMGTLLQNPSKCLLKNKTYYIMCQSGGRSARTVKELLKNGFQVINVNGGIGAYRGTKRK